MGKLSTYFVASVLTLSSSLCAQEITSVVHATPEWSGFTNEDGTGLYNEVLKAVFAEKNVAVERQYVPMNRALVLVERGDADLTGGFTRDERNFAATPIYETTIAVMFPAGSDFTVESLDDLEGLRVVGAPQMSATIGKEVDEVDSRSQAVKLLLSNRVDVYVDLLLALETLRDTGKSELDVENATDTQFDINPADWQIAPILTKQLFMLFPGTERGKNVRDLYDEGTRALAASGKLGEIYNKYAAETPSTE